MPKISVSPTESRKSRTPYARPLSAWAKKSGTNTREKAGGRAAAPGPRQRRPLRGQGAAGARVGHVRDLVDHDVVQTARDLFDLAHVDEGLDDVVRLGVEAEAAARAVELRLLDDGHQLFLVLRVAVDGLERAHDRLRRVVALAGEAVGHLVGELLAELLHEALVDGVVEQRRVEVAGNDAERGRALRGQHVGLGEEARAAQLDRLLETELVELLHEVDGVAAGEEGVARLGTRLADLGEV